MQDLISWRLLQGKNLKWTDLCTTLILGRIVKLGYYRTWALLVSKILGDRISSIILLDRVLHSFGLVDFAYWWKVVFLGVLFVF